FNAVRKNFFPNWYQRRPYNCCELPGDEPGALERRHGKLKKYLHSVEEMRPMERGDRIKDRAGDLQHRNRALRCGARLEEVQSRGWGIERATPEASRRLGHHREGSGTFLEQLVEHGIITHEVFTIQQPANCTEDGELTIGSWEAQRPEESGTLVHLPTSSPRKWMAMLSSTA
ncbi:hypothetical protein FOZ62_018174, partial [Perkinsus olseni]